MAARSSLSAMLALIVLPAVALLLSSTSTHVSAQFPSPASGCTPAITSLTPCLGFITGNSTTPSGQCCSQLASVVQTQARCLCLLLTQTLPAGFPPVNQTQALTLPGACKIQTPPLRQCNVIAPAPAPATSPVSSPGPVSSPAAAPAGNPSSPADTPASATLPPAAASPDASGGSKTARTNGPASSASSVKLSLSMFLFLVMSSTLAASI